MKLFKNKTPAKYSHKWFESISDDDLHSEREPVRQAFLRGESGAERLLGLFDDEQIKRMNEKYRRENPDAKPRYREHGWYLSNDD